MKELLRTTDVVRLSWVTALLKDAGIDSFQLDYHASLMDGSIGAVPRRLMVLDAHWDSADQLVRAADAEIAAEIAAETTAHPLPTDAHADGAGESGSMDLLLGGRLRLRQPDAGYRAAIDPVLLAAFTRAVPGDKVLDIGTGTAAAALCLAARVDGVAIVGLEKLPEAAEIARANVALNAAGDRITVVEGDLLRPPISAVQHLAPGSFQRVMMNPPYLKAGTASVPPDPWKAAANVEGEARLGDWVKFAHRMLAARGELTLVHRADRFDDIMAALTPAFGSLVLVPLWPRAGGDARRLLVRAVKGGKSPARLTSGLVLHAEGSGGYSEAAEAILRDANPLDP